MKNKLLAFFVQALLTYYDRKNQELKLAQPSVENSVCIACAV